jgi:hypothetical protein
VILLDFNSKQKKQIADCRFGNILLDMTNQTPEIPHPASGIPFGITSEVGKLRKVLVHQPDLSLHRLTPANHDSLLFDDLLWVEHAQIEHDNFTAIVHERSVEVYYLEQLMVEALQSHPQAQQRIVRGVITPLTVGLSLIAKTPTPTRLSMMPALRHWKSTALNSALVTAAATT